MHVPDTDTETSETSQTKPFAAFLQEQQRGVLHSELSVALAQVAAAVHMHKKPGSLTLTIKITPAKFDGAVVVHDDVKVKLPEADRDAGLFYPDEHGNLNRNDPRQPELPHIREAGRTPASQTRSAR